EPTVAQEPPTTQSRLAHRPLPLTPLPGRRRPSTRWPHYMRVSAARRGPSRLPPPVLDWPRGPLAITWLAHAVETERCTVGNVSVSLGLFPIESPQRIIHLTKLAEDVGYSCVQVGDSQMIWREAYVLLGAAAMATSSIILPTG